MRNIQKSFEVLKKGAGRDIGLLIFMLVFGVSMAVVALPIIWVMQFLPDWGWWILGAAWIVWLVFGDSLANAWSAYRGERDD